MRLSELVALAGDKDPEILIVEDSLPDGKVGIPLESRGFPKMRDGQNGPELLIAASTIEPAR